MARVHVKLDLGRMRLNLEQTARAPQSHEEVLRLLAAMGVWRVDEERFSVEADRAKVFLTGRLSKSERAVRTARSPGSNRRPSKPN